MKSNILDFWNEVAERKNQVIEKKSIDNNSSENNIVERTEEEKSLYNKEIDDMKQRIEILKCLKDTLMIDVRALNEENNTIKKNACGIIKQMSEIISKFMGSDIMHEVIYDEAINAFENKQNNFDFTYFEEIMNGSKDDRPLSVVYDEYFQNLPPEEKGIDNVETCLDTYLKSIEKEEKNNGNNIIQLKEYKK